MTTYPFPAIPEDGDMAIELKCDRCHKIVKGMQFGGGTSGFYNLETTWKEYARPGEKNICDECMNKDPNYRAEYQTWVRESIKPEFQKEVLGRIN